MVVLVEIERKVKEIREIMGKPPSDEGLVSILFTVTVKDAKTNVSSTMTTDATFPHLRDKVRAYATLMGGSPGKGPALMDIDQIGEKENEESWDNVTWWDEEWRKESHDDQGLTAVVMTAGARVTKGIAQTQKVNGKTEKEAKARKTKMGKGKGRNNGKEKEKARGEVHAGSAEVRACRETARHIRRPVEAGQCIKRDPPMTLSEASSDALQ